MRGGGRGAQVRHNFREGEAQRFEEFEVNSLGGTS